MWDTGQSLIAEALNSNAGVLARSGQRSSGQLGNLGRVLQQDASAGALDGDSSGADVPGCRTPWETFNSTAELSFWAEALQTVGFAGALPLSALQERGWKKS